MADEPWVLKGILDGEFFRTVWMSQAGAIADRQRRLSAQRKKIRGQWKSFIPSGWTVIARARNEPY